jgi:hypothetical protein
MRAALALGEQRELRLPARFVGTYLDHAVGPLSHRDAAFKLNYMLGTRPSISAHQNSTTHRVAICPVSSPFPSIECLTNSPGRRNLILTPRKGPIGWN